ncbi:hypothetical protein HDV00_010016 [Rhizophlyctis rosea]|nr:hypothetical protein HDV00_010016 [Rhizophlyctis rosea]
MKTSTCIALTALAAVVSASPLYTQVAHDESSPIVAFGDFGWRDWQPLDSHYCALFNNKPYPINDCDDGDRAALPTATAQQIATAQFLADVCEERRCKGLISTGDNFYNSGLKLHDTFSINRFYSAFVHTYNRSSLNFPWYMTMGNHDVLGDPEFLTQLAPKLDKRWIMPHNYYAHTVEGKDWSALFVHYDSDCYISNYQNKTSVYNTAYVQNCHKFTSQQNAWMEDSLESSEADFKFVVGHHPIYSSSTNYTTDLAQVNNVIKKYHATYLNGHDHCLGHYQVEGAYRVKSLEQQNINQIIKGTNYILSGAGSYTEARACNDGQKIGPYVKKLFGDGVNSRECSE